MMKSASEFSEMILFKRIISANFKEIEVRNRVRVNALTKIN